MKRIVSFLALCVVALALVTASETSTQPPPPPSPWRLVVDDEFDSGGVPEHWSRYDGPYGSGPENCARPDHAFVEGGALHMVLSYRSSGACGAGWYSAGMMLSKRFQSVDQKISVRFRVTRTDGVRGHRVIPMRWPSSGTWPAAGEEDFCEGTSLTGCTTFLHNADGQEASNPYRLDLERWHTVTFVRRHFTILAFIDGRLRWVYHGTPRTLPPTLKRPVLQLECDVDGCPSGTQGQETVLVDWVKVWNLRAAAGDSGHPPAARGVGRP